MALCKKNYTTAGKIAPGAHGWEGGRDGWTFLVFLLEPPLPGARTGSVWLKSFLKFKGILYLLPGHMWNTLWEVSGAGVTPPPRLETLKKLDSHHYPISGYLIANTLQLALFKASPVQLVNRWVKMGSHWGPNQPSGLKTVTFQM